MLHCPQSHFTIFSTIDAQRCQNQSSCVFIPDGVEGVNGVDRVDEIDDDESDVIEVVLLQVDDDDNDDDDDDVLNMDKAEEGTLEQ